jgi:hypothetical protein
MPSPRIDGIARCSGRRIYEGVELPPPGVAEPEEPEYAAAE